jgi:threonine/homoserine/homoserine lactone efflux protein
MARSLALFVPVAALLAVTPGPATAMVVQTTARGGRSRALHAVLGNATGLAVWAIASMLGVSALIVASETAYAALKIAGAVILVGLGVQAIRRARAHQAEPQRTAALRQVTAFRLGVVTALSNPKVAIFYVALLPQFVPKGHAVLPATILFAAVQIAMSCSWYLVLASALGYVRPMLTRWRPRFEALTGATMIAFGLKFAGDQR